MAGPSNPHHLAPTIADIPATDPTHGVAMRVLNFGSINIDHVYFVDHLVRPGETLASLGFRRHAGGKGFTKGSTSR
jgi:hypothetical protein